MSPNGRKAWRKWAKARRRWLNMDERRYRDPYEDEPLIKHRYAWFEAKKQFGPKLVCPKAKPFTPRSLVGMTQGARKRIRRAISGLLDKAHGNLASIGHQHDATRDDSFLRIGQKLRPCPGCCACGAIEPGTEYPIPWCDGSGVLPARKENQ